MSQIPPRVSVIVPAFNQGRFLGQTLESVLAQSMSEWECIVVDDGSGDETGSIAAGFARRDPRIRMIAQANQGPSVSRNRGIRESRGEFIQFLDADDLISPEKLVTHVRYLDSHPGVDLVYSDVTFFHDDRPDVKMWSMGGKLSRSTMVQLGPETDPFPPLEHHNIMPILAPLSRRSIIVRAGCFDEDVLAHEDHALWLRCAAVGGRFAYMQEFRGVASVRVHAQSLSQNRELMVRGTIQAAEAFERRIAMIGWDRGRLPLVYEVALGIDAAFKGSRWKGARRIWMAATQSAESLTSLRWRAYAFGSLVLPRVLLRILVTTPMPERLFEIYRQFFPAARDY